MTKPIFDKVLIANRGEIAIRIIKTLRKMGITSVAVYSESDLNALHVKLADEAYYIGNAPATESYLSIPKLIRAVRDSGANAVHPGYGFLSENYNFATALAKTGVKLIGPSAKAIKYMGDKIEAKKIANKAGIQTVPGYIGTVNGYEHANEIARSLGFPVIVKAAAGGGGRGMRIVQDEAEMEAAYSSATSEALYSFEDSRLFIEKLIEKPRHIEVQVLADKYGNVVCLGERECSIQRQHQKVIEEAPSVFVDQEMRQEMFRQSVSLCKEVEYYSAGTIEFIVDADKNFYFLEMNTRLQVEHTVTELTTGIDIVEHMIRVAAGEKLAFKQEDIKCEGHAIECRICAEDPSRGFLPSSGRIYEYKEPNKSLYIRLDTSIVPGSEVSMFYDSMIAKLCSWDYTREQAIGRMKLALSTFVIKGISHNISFLEAIINHPRFISADISTSFIDEEYPGGFTKGHMTYETIETFLSVSIFVFITEQKRAAGVPGQLTNQLNKISNRWIVSIDKELFPIVIRPVEGGYKVRYGGNRIVVKSDWVIGSTLFQGDVNGRRVNVRIERIRGGYLVTYVGVTSKVFIRSARVAELEAIVPSKDDKLVFKRELTAPLTGTILQLNVTPGMQVAPGQPLVRLSAMKMENVVTADSPAIIDQVHVQEGQSVSSGQLLISFKRLSGAAT